MVISKCQRKNLYPDERIGHTKEFLRRFWNMEDVDRYAHVKWDAKDNLQNIVSPQQMLGQLLRHIENQSRTKDDYLPALWPYLGTGILASAFGCEIVQFEGGQPWAKPIITRSEEVYGLRVPSVRDGLLGKTLEYITYFQEETGYSYPIRTGDIQGPLGVAGQVWQDEQLFIAMHTNPKEVHCLLNLTTNLIIEFIKAEKSLSREFFNIHWPLVWMPEELGTGISEDYAPLLSPSQYEEFGLPYVNRISDEFGGIYIHCCGNFEHNFDNFLKIKNLRGLNVGINSVSWERLQEKFSERCVLIPGPTEQGIVEFGGIEKFLQYILEHTLPDTHLFLID